MCAKKFQISSRTWLIGPGCTYMRTKDRNRDRGPRRHIGTVGLVLGLAAAALIGRAALSPSSPLRAGSHAGATDQRPGAHSTGPLIAPRGSGVTRAQPSTVGGSTSQSTNPSRRKTSLQRPPEVSVTSLAPPPLPSAAVGVAAAYAVATYGWSAGETFGQWISAVTPLVTASWLSRLASAEPDSPSVPTSVSVVAVIAAHGSDAELRADVVVTLEPGGGRALLVNLVSTPAGWAVDGAS
jgi:hypothetical protein